ncbi:MAG: alkaline phosphatase D family protein [Bacteroidota bacterium]
MNEVSATLSLGVLTVTFLLATLGPQLLAQPLQTPYTLNDKDWYNRKVGLAKYLIEVVEGDPVVAIQQARKQGGDAEADFILALAYAQLGIADSSLFYLRESLEKRLPAARYLIPGAIYLQKIQQLAGFKELMKGKDTGLYHGPMLGGVRNRQLQVWLRVKAGERVTIIYSRDKRFISTQRVSGVSNSQTGLITLKIRNLEIAQPYFYKVKVGEKEFEQIHNFRIPFEREVFSVVFGGGAAYIPWHHHMWSTIASHRPDALFMLGDNVYIDYPEKPYVQQYCYHRRQSEAHWRKLVANTPTYAIWDDHDFGDNDEYGTSDPDFPMWKKEVLAMFKKQWVNPGYGGPNEFPGVFFELPGQQVDFFFLDGRYYREGSFVRDSAGKQLSMLGITQMKWLKERLLKSTAKFKVIISPVPWSFTAKPEMQGRMDTWAGYKAERRTLFSFLSQQNIKGVFLLSADRHRSDIWKIERKEGYPLYEFSSSRLTNTHYHPIMEGSLFGYNSANSFGKLSFQLRGPDAKVTYEIYSIENELIYTFDLPLTHLKDEL